MKAFTKKYLAKIVSDCGGEARYSGHDKVMYIHHLVDRWTFSVCTAYLFNDIKIKIV
jgi:hypothetical protein